ncbi:hypothetical protein [Amycolatopsis sp. BJA-103]|uniref:hypothetical protein n=1 Tax=unclassified Amycolatopsis TaxID=2618356 RepID=UPI000CA24975|nr:hypothetical protein [Amycolatopsis sp. BJA-103]AUI60921.1 hypothetical protein BKN51_23860 [Amycolatopsis sp. BJA-103]PNE21792.1 hypothetical protein B1H26_08620 [Amycolatopsis sp. BJA-103]
MIRSLILTAAATLTAVATLPGTAAADKIGTPAPCVKATDVTGADFDVKQCGVSDVDQFRAGLENDGNAYCGPASLYNVLHYWGHVKNAPVGWVTTRVGQLDPKDPADYNVITNSIGRIGVDAKYDGKTTLGNLQKAWTIATKPARDAGWTSSTGNVSTAGTADFSGELAKKLNEGPLQIAYGRYKAGPWGSLQRSGGHIVTVVAAKGSFNGDTVQLKLSDPGRAGDHKAPGYLGTQSEYQLLDVTLEKKTIWEYRPVTDDPDTGVDESLEPGTFRFVERWELTGPQYIGSTRQMIENFNWFDMVAP